MGITQKIPEGTELHINFRKFYGVDTANDASSMRVGEDGIRLTKGTNIDITRLFEMELRDGYAVAQAGIFKNAWSSRGIFFAVMNNNLVRVTKVAGSLTFTTLWYNAGDRKLIYCDTGDDIMISDSTVLKYYRDGALSEVSDPTTTFKRKMPAGVLLEHHKSRFYSIVGNLFYYSDVAKYHQYDIRIPLKPYPSDILMFKALSTGVWLSDSQSTYFLADMPASKELGAKQFEVGKKFDYPAAFLGTGKRVFDIISPLDRFYPEALIWTSTKGICIGGKDGSVENLTEKTSTMPSVTEGTDFYRKKNNSNQYITLLKTRG